MKNCGHFVYLALGALAIFNFQAQAQPALGKTKGRAAPRVIRALPPGIQPERRLPPGVRPGEQKGPVTPNMILSDKPAAKLTIRELRGAVVMSRS